MTCASMTMATCDHWFAGMSQSRVTASPSTSSWTRLRFMPQRMSTEAIGDDRMLSAVGDSTPAGIFTQHSSVHGG